MRIFAVGLLSEGLTSPEGPHSSPPLQSDLGRIGMRTFRLPEALWPTEKLAAPSKQHGLAVQLDTLLTLYLDLSRP